MVKISVIIPVYNVSKYLDEAITSVLNQTFEDMELICVNDGSTDNSQSILEKYALKDSRVKIYNKSNGGCGSARNFGLDIASGDYIYFFDPDDRLSPNTLKKSYNSAVLNKTSIVIFKAMSFMQDNLSDGEIYFNLDKTLKQKNYENFTFNFTDIKDFVLGDGFAPWSKLYKKEFLDSYDDFCFDEDMAFDGVAFHIKSLLRAENISYVNEVLYQYRIDNSDSVNNTPVNAFDIFRACDEVEKILINENLFKDFEKKFYTFKINHILAYIISADREDYYKIAREEFLKIKTVNVSQNHDKFNLVINTKDYNEFKKKFLKIEIERLKNILDTLKNENLELNQDLRQLKKLNNELMSSKSWKLTEPLRKIKKMV